MRPPSRPSLVAALAALAALASSGCSDGPKRRPLGGTCGDDSECEAGVCGGGICLDPAQDEDRDGLTNGLELGLGTNPVAADTDNDGTDDQDEVDGQLANLDIDGDGIPDALESATVDDDGDCIPNQFDPDNDTSNSDLTGLVPIVCRRVGVCAGASLAVTCPGGAGTAVCDYGAVVGFEAEEASCDGLDNDCDGATDETGKDLDEDGVADCVDADRDQDGHENAVDDCPEASDPTQLDSDGDGQGDACDAPTAPVVTAIAPGVVGQDAAPELSGRADPRATVEVFARPGCEGAADASAAADLAGAWSATVTVSANETSFSVRARNGGGLTSACVPSAFGYRRDSSPPLGPTNVSATPPSGSLTPRITGEAEPGAHVVLYVDAECATTAQATVAVSDAGRFAVTAYLTTAGVHHLAAIVVDAAGNASACTPLLDYTYDLPVTPPPLAVSAPFDPPSPSSDRDVKLYACAQTSATLEVFAGSCDAPAVATSHTSAQLGCPAGMTAFQAAVTAPANTTTTWYGRATDPSTGLASACTWLGAYTHDDLPPGAPTLRTLEPPSPSASPLIELVADADGATSLFAWWGADCAGAPDAGLLVGAATTLALPRNQTSQLRARAVDDAGNLSACTLLTTYTQDDLAPPAPSAHPTPFAPASPAPSTAPTVAACTSGSLAVDVFAGTACTGAPKATLTAVVADAACPSGRAVSGAITVASGATPLYGRSTGGNGVASACAYLGTYVQDSVAPAAPVLAVGKPTPASPSPSLAPRYEGTAEAGARVTLHAIATCLDAPLARGVAEQGSWQLNPTLPANATTTVYAKATDAAGNASACATFGPYRTDTVPPPAPRSTLAPEPPDRKTADTPVRGCTEAFDTVEVFGDATCAQKLGSGLAATPDASCGGTEPTAPLQQFAFTVAAPADRRVTLYGRTVDAAGNASSCVALRDAYYDTTPPGPATIHGTRAIDWTRDGVTFAVDGAPAEGDRGDAAAVVIHEVDADFVAGPCPASSEVGQGDAGTASFEGTADAIRDHEVWLAAELVDRAGNGGVCGAPVRVVALSSASAAIPDLATATRWVTIGARVLWHLPDGRLAEDTTTDDVTLTAEAYTFEGMVVTVPFQHRGDGTTAHVLRSFALAPGSSVELREGTLVSKQPAVPGVYLTVFASQLQCEGCAYYPTYAILGCGQQGYFYNGSSSTSVYVGPDCMENFVCKTTNADGQCVAYSYDVTTAVVTTDYSNQLMTYLPTRVTTLTQADTEPWVSYEGETWRSDFEETDVSISDTGYDTRLVTASFSSVRGDHDINLSGSTMPLVLPQMPGGVTGRFVPGLGDGWSVNISKLFTIGAGVDAGGLQASSMMLAQFEGKPVAHLDVDLATDTLPLMLPVAMPDYSDPDRPFVELYQLGTAEVPELLLSRFEFTSVDGRESLLWVSARDGGAGLALHYPEMPDDLPELKGGYYALEFRGGVIAAGFDFAPDWFALRDRMGTDLLVLGGNDGKPVTVLPRTFKVKASFCCDANNR